MNKQDEQALARATEMLEQTGALAQVGGWSVDLTTMKLTWTRETFRIAEIETGVEPSLEEGINLFAPEARPVIEAAVKAAIDSGTHYDLELPLITAKGNRRWVRTQGSAEFQEGKVIRIYGTFQDITARRAVMEALQESEFRYRTLVENSPYCVHEIDLAGRMISMNLAGLKMLSLDDEIKIKNQPYLQFVGQRDYERVAGLLKAALAGQASEFVFKGSNGREYQSTFMPITDKDGSVQRLMGLSIDITERKQTELALRESETRLQLALAGAELGLWDWDLVTGKVLFDMRWCGMIGYTTEELLPNVSTWLELMHPEDAPVVQSILERHLRGETMDYETEFRLRHKDGRWIWILARGKVMFRDPDGTPLRMLGTHMDLSARKMAEAALRSSEARAHAIINSSPVPMALNDEKQRITFLNPAFTETFGYELVDIPMLTDWWHKAYPDSAYRQQVIERWQAELDRSAQTETAFVPMELNIRCKDGTNRVVLVGAAPLENSFVGEHLVVLHDITVRTQAEQSMKLAHSVAEAASRAKSEFLANMSHEIRTPLTTILGFADILAENETIDQTPENRNQILDTIKSAGAHLLTILNDILDLSKIEADKLTFEHVDTQLVNILCDIERQMRQTAENKGVALSFELSSPLPDRILCDPTRLRQILMNLVGNAVKFTEAGSVAVTAGADIQDGKTRLVIDVADTGPGMTPEQVLGLFTVFGQADSSVTRKYGGSGLGLVICRRLANLMGGDVILLRSEAGKGSCFRLVLPLQQFAGSIMVNCLTPLMQVNDEPKPIAVALKLSGRILLAEDGLVNQSLIVFLLRKAGAIVETADNGVIALEMLDQAEAAGTPFDMLLTDMQMPEMDGYVLARTLRDRGSKLPIIAITAHAMVDDRKKCIDAGCDDYISKPINKANLISVCAAWMRKTS